MNLLLHLTEYIEDETNNEIIERPLLLNPEAIEAIKPITMDTKGIPIIGSNSHVKHATGITLRSSRKHAIKDSLEEIEAKVINALRFT